MSRLRGIALGVFAVGLTAFAVRNIPPWAARGDTGPNPLDYATQAQRRLLAHHTDSIHAIDGRTLRPVALALPNPRPAVVFLYQADCPACRESKPGWEGLARRIDDRAHVMAATVDPPRPEGAFISAPSVLDLHLDLASFRRAFAASEVVPITLLIAPSGRVSWERLGPLGEAATDSLFEALSR
jgi:hypothetical protein